MSKPGEVDPEVQAAEDALKAAGLQDASMVDGGDPGRISPQAGEPEPTPAPSTVTPPASPEPPKPTGPSVEELHAQLADLQNQVKSVGELREWAEREKKRADGEREERQRVQTELDTVRRAAVGVKPDPTQVTGGVDLSGLDEQERVGVEWLAKMLPRVASKIAPTVVQHISEEALASHPAIRKRDIAIHLAHEQAAQAEFMSMFPKAEDRKAVRESLMPVLKARLQAKRATGDFHSTYLDVYEEARNSFKAQAALLGLDVADPTAPVPAKPVASPAAAAPAPPAPVQVPPTLVGVPGGSAAPVATEMVPLSREQLAVFGLA